MKRAHRYCGAISFKDLKTIIVDSLDTSSSMVFHPRLSIRGLPRASKLLFVIILAARFWSFCSCLMSVKLIEENCWICSLFADDKDERSLCLGRAYGLTNPVERISNILKIDSQTPSVIYR